jgi:hypothetical protein
LLVGWKDLVEVRVVYFGLPHEASAAVVRSDDERIAASVQVCSEVGDHAEPKAVDLARLDHGEAVVDASAVRACDESGPPGRRRRR